MSVRDENLGATIAIARNPLQKSSDLKTPYFHHNRNTMASSRTPLLADPHRNSHESNYYHEDDDEETRFLYGFATTSPTRPFATSFKPTITLRLLALIIAIPAFSIFCIHGPMYAGVIVFLSFAIARQVIVLGAHFGSQFIHIKIEVVHPRLKDVSTKAQEAWIQKSAAATIDGIILLGLLITLSLIAHQVDVCGGPCDLPASTTAAVILGFIAL
jgi:hypothetical protein